MRRTIPTIFSVLLAASAGAQAPQPLPSFVSEVRVNNISVDVQVRDTDGVPVEGLTRDDFRVFENGVEQPLTNFFAVRGGQVSAARDESLVGRPAPRQALLFFDLYLMAEPEKRQVLERVREHLEGGLPPAMTVAVVSFDGQLRVHTEPTASRETLLGALKEVSRLSATGLQRQIKLSSFDVSDLPSRESWGTYQLRRTQNDEYWFEMRRMVGRVSAAFTASLQRFSATPSRKLAMLVSPGFPRADNVPLYRDYDFFFDRPPEYRNAGLLADAAFAASELEYTLFTLDPTGSQLLTADASRGTSDEFVDVANIQFWREADRKDSLIRAAELTGGRALFTSDASAAIADVERLTASFYSLGYQPDHAGDGKAYSIRVEVAGHPDYQLTYRSSYVDRPFDQRDAERSRAALLTGQQSNALGLELVLDKPKSRFKLGGRVHEVAADLRIPFANLTMLPRGEIAWGQVQIVVVGVDTQGNQSELAAQRVPIELRAEQLEDARRRGYYSYKFTLQLASGDTSVRIAVNDTLAHTTSTLIADLDL